MAKGTAKANVKTNAVRLRNFWAITVACNLVHLAAIWFFSGFPPTFWQLTAVSFWAGQQFLAMKVLGSRGAPSFDAAGNVDECINLADPDQLGLAGYAQDLLWVSWALQVLANVVSGYFSMLWLAVPTYGVHKAWGTFIAPMLAQRSQAQQQQQQAMQQQAQQYQQQQAAGQPETLQSQLRKRQAEARGKGQARR